jgi:hypothetical protein
MKQHIKRSRITKALTDRENGPSSFPAAEGRLNLVRVAIMLALDQAGTGAGQAAALTAINVSFKCFGNATLVGECTLPLVTTLPIGKTIGEAATMLGATVAHTVPPETTHLIGIGDAAGSGTAAFVRCWWNGWNAGIVPPWDDRCLGASGNPLAGVFSGALAVREIFATVLGYLRCGSRVSIASLWEPGTDPETTNVGPDAVYIPPRLWFIGLGHLGQGILWSLGLLPIPVFEAVLQDDQKAGEENEATGLLTRSSDIGQRKTRIAAKWLDRPGWSTRLIERRHYGDIPVLDQDPTIVITGLDEPGVRIQIANGEFEYLIDAGIGHGPIDFEALQIRVLKKGVDPRMFWSTSETAKNVDILLERIAYCTHEATSDQCGARTLANASVAVPFVGAGVGALVIAQAIRLASMQATVQMMQMELGAPGMAVLGALNTAASESRGTIEMRFAQY